MTTKLILTLGLFSINTFSWASSGGFAPFEAQLSHIEIQDGALAGEKHISINVNDLAASLAPHAPGNLVMLTNPQLEDFSIAEQASLSNTFSISLEQIIDDKKITTTHPCIAYLATVSNNPFVNPNGYSLSIHIGSSERGLYGASPYGYMGFPGVDTSELSPILDKKCRDEYFRRNQGRQLELVVKTQDLQVYDGDSEKIIYNPYYHNQDDRPVFGF